MAKVLTPARRARLEKLAAYLEGLPADYSHFTMQDYVTAPNGTDDLRRYALKNGGVQHCGTAACAVGHGPAAGIFMSRSLARQFGSQQPWKIWNAYAKTFIGSDPDDSMWAHNNLFEWLFGEYWRAIDDHHYGAAARIRYLLDNGPPPEDWEYDRSAVALYAPYRIDAKAKANA